MSIEIQNVGKSFGSFAALKDVSLQVHSGELVALLGPSGSGKTTLLRIIAGLETVDRGKVLFHGEDTTALHVRQRQVGFVFQHYALFRHLTVFENVAFGLRVRPRKSRPLEKEITERVNNLLKLVQLDGWAHQYPSQLSGGQRQRIALARALAVEPRMLLLDEPFGALDAKVRKELRRWLRRLHDEIHITSVFVTHDQEEALEVADRVVVMNEGRIEQIGTAQDVYDHPATPFVYQFLGSVNVFRGYLQRGRMRIGEVELEVPGHAEDQQLEPLPAIAYVRPHDIEIESSSKKTGMKVRVEQVFVIGPTVRLELSRLDQDELIQAEISRERYQQLTLVEGNYLYIRPRYIKVFTIADQNIPYAASLELKAS